MTLAGMEIKTEVNLNTIVVLVGFLITFAGLVSVWNGVQFRQLEAKKWITTHEESHRLLREELVGLHSVDDSRTDISFRMGQLEKAHEAAETRINRVVESYGNQFSDIRNTLGQINTQLALTNQALQRMEAFSQTNPPPQRGLIK